jgi:glycine/D-amino acid oxidase-like deaminating enzyme
MKAVAVAAAGALGVWLWWRRRGGAATAGTDAGGGIRARELAPGVLVDTARPARARLERPGHVVVVGSGIVGVAIAAELARRGTRVTVLDQESAPAMCATRCSWAWINANSKQPRHYQELNHLAMRVWEAMLPGFVTWCGALLLGGAPPQESPAYQGAALDTVAEILGLEPSLAADYFEARPGPAVHFAQEGLTDPQLAVAHLVRLAEERGATFVYGASVRGYPWEMEGDVAGVTFTRGGATEEVRADVVVLANGTGVSKLARAAGVRIPLLHKPGVLTWLQPGASEPVRLNKIIVAKDLHFLQRPDGLIAVGESKETGGTNSQKKSVESDFSWQICKDTDL